MFHPIKEQVLERMLERVSMALLLSSKSTSTKRYVNLQVAKIKKIFCYQKLPFKFTYNIFLGKRKMNTTINKTTFFQYSHQNYSIRGSSKQSSIYT